MKLLAIETSAVSVSAAVVEDGRLIASAYQNTALTHSRTLMPMVDAMLQTAELRLADMDCFAVAAGPGSFTGLRIGISAVKGLAWALEKPCLAVSTLEAMAYSLRHMDCTIVCAMDARRQQIYNALFRAGGGTLTRLCGDRAIALSDLCAELCDTKDALIVVGDGAKLCADYLAENGIPCTLAPPHLVMQSAAGVAMAGEELAKLGAFVTAQELAPVYLRLSQAERERLARQKEAESENTKREGE
ncbi:MAG: tRNA (adenosine(37)-N6)-threonylcarbamoyltransferase complex dimerization subunit type 1 TsaB [Oscillospiraceae bacterium]|nr:tRNA (adenosine(37)-N6)-threonylcarbamoyltransferase complex dimerization subunit type 1 TsaB [Oscillospiraceae bacterium]